jgi:hypothetical protein
MDEQLLTKWTIFFDALRLQTQRVTDTPSPGLQVLDLYGPGQHVVWLPVPKFPEHTLIEDAGRYADRLGKPIFVVIGPPEPPQVKLWEDGFMYAEGAVGIALSPSSAWLGGEPQYRYNPAWHALQDDYWGSLDIRPLYAEELPLKEKPYSLTTTCPTIVSGPMVTCYMGCGRSPAGPRLKAAYEAVQAVK